MTNSNIGHEDRRPVPECAGDMLQSQSGNLKFHQHSC